MQTSRSRLSLPDHVVRLEPLGENELPVPAGRITSRGDGQLHWVLLALSAGVLVVSSFLEVRGTQEVVLPLVNLPLPGVCSYKRFVGSECPGCGMTRCFISMAHGDLRRAWDFNPAGTYFFVLVGLQLPYRAVQIWRLRRGQTELCLGWMTTFTLGSLAVALLAQWTARACTSFFL